MMYRIKEDKVPEMKEYRTKLYSEKTGLNANYLSSILNSTINCSEIIAKSILSVKFNISFYDIYLNELLKEYFEEE